MMNFLSARHITIDRFANLARLFLLSVLLIVPTLLSADTPALIPLPKSVTWANKNYLLQNFRSIYVNDPALEKFGIDLAKILGKKSAIARQKNATSASILLKVANDLQTEFGNEGYSLSINNNKIVLTASRPHGIFNGLQTLRQLVNGKKTIPACEIKDWPAFQWRGYMVDVGRNYQSMDLLKQQIEVMSHYKLNVFHFHPTENIAWRIATKKYPQLTDSSNMIRDKGKFYSEKDMKELIQFCQDRFITFVPEIDMPGHSASFTRAFGFDMQSEKGFAIIKEIVKEFCETYDLPYFHIGADEVKFTNKDFIPEMVALLHSMGKQTIGWHPGGNYDDSTIRQLWESEGMDNPKARYIDSRSLYLNHMDPLESVVSIFERQLLDTTQGDEHKLGGEICLWNDRRAAKEEDLIRMNPVYPGMLAFAERSWRGGGFSGEVVDIGPDGSDRAEAFKEFENRLIIHKHLYFKNLPFPYVRQSNIHWKLLGPFENDGDITKSFWPENKDVSITDSTADLSVTGGTIYLRHWWFPTLTSWIKDPKENTTWYAYTKIYRDKEEDGKMWIGFDDLSRSPATDDPQAGTWDNRGSQIRINGNVIAPPEWKYAGAKGNSEVPLVDEGYSYRAPTVVHFKKGWNVILIKAPVKSFKGKDWQNPVKWMFTAVPVKKGEGVNWDEDE